MGRSAELHVVLGATGAVGNAVVRELLHREHRVRAVHKNSGRVPAACEQVRADLLTPWDARIACAGASVIYHCAQPDGAQWHREFPAMTRIIMQAAGDAGAKIVFPDRLDAYGRVDGPVNEQTPERPAGARGKVRSALVGMLLSAHRLGRTRVTIGRASDYYGPNGLASVAGAPLFGPALRGERARWIGPLDRPHSLHYLDDLARGLVTLGEQDKADGAVWHLPASEAVTGREFLEIVYGQLGLVPLVTVVSHGHVALRGMSMRRIGDLRETLVRFSVPLVVDAAAFETTFGALTTTPHEEGVAETLSWFRVYRG